MKGVWDTCRMDFEKAVVIRCDQCGNENNWINYNSDTDELGTKCKKCQVVKYYIGREVGVGRNPFIKEIEI